MIIMLEIHNETMEYKLRHCLKIIQNIKEFYCFNKQVSIKKLTLIDFVCSVITLDTLFGKIVFVTL